MVRRISDSVKQVLSDEEVKKKKQQLRAKLLKIKLAGINLPGPATPEARRGLIQDTPVSGSEGNQNKLKQNNDYINKKKPIRPTGADAEFTDKQSLAKEHGHAIVFKGIPIGPYKVASLVENQGHYAKYWLLNAKQTNGNGWGIAAHTAKDNMSKFIGRPLVVTASSWHGASQYGDSYEHPYLATNDMNQIFAHQEKFRVGNIVSVEGDKNGDYFATIEMLPKFANMVLPPFCSPAIYQLDAQEHEGNISKWEALHLAALDENPAYGARIALLKGTCVGTSSSCSIQFKSAKLETSVACPAQKRINVLKTKVSMMKIATEDWDAFDEESGTMEKDMDMADNEADYNSYGKELDERYAYRKKNHPSVVKKANIFDEQEENKDKGSASNIKTNTKGNRAFNKRRKEMGLDPVPVVQPKRGLIAALKKKQKIAGDDFDDFGPIELSSSQNREVKGKSKSRKREKGMNDRVDTIFRERRKDKDIPVENESQKRKDTLSRLRKITPSGKKLAKLRLKLAALGMNNMTYQKSKPVKILKKKHPEVRKAALDMADILRKTGTSKDGTHAHSSWMTKTGEFVGGGEAHINQVMDADPEFHKAQGNVESDDIVTNFAKKHELIRVQSFPTNRAGESRTSFGIHHKPSSGQLRSMKSLEDSGEVIGHATGPDHRAATTGEGFKSIRQSIGKHFP